MLGTAPASTHSDGGEEPPGLRFLRRLVIVLTVLLFACLFIVVIAIVVGLAELGESPSAHPSGQSTTIPSDSAPAVGTPVYARTIAIGANERVVETFVVGNRIHFRTADPATGRARMVTIAGDTGEVIGVIDLSPE